MCDAFYCALLFAFLPFFSHLLSSYTVQNHIIAYATHALHTRNFAISSPRIHIPPPGRSMPPLMCYHHPTLHHLRHHPTSSTDILIHVYLIAMALHHDQTRALHYPPQPISSTLISASHLISSLGSLILYYLITPFPSYIRDVQIFTLFSLVVHCIVALGTFRAFEWCLPHQKRRPSQPFTWPLIPLTSTRSNLPNGFGLRIYTLPLYRFVLVALVSDDIARFQTLSNTFSFSVVYTRTRTSIIIRRYPFFFLILYIELEGIL